MTRTALIAFGACSLLGLLSGCAADRACCEWLPQPAGLIAEGAPLTACDELQLDLAALPDRAALDGRLLPGTAAERGLPIDAQQVQCLAAANATLANLLEAESRFLSHQAAGLFAPVGNTTALHALLLHAYAVELRNAAAADALELFYRLAEVDLLATIVEESLREVDQAANQLEQLRAQGLPGGTDESALTRQRLQLLDQQLQLQLTRGEINRGLAGLLGMTGDDIAFCPRTQLDVAVAPVDVSLAIAMAMQQRGELIALRLLYARLDAGTLPLAQETLSAAHWLLAVTGESQRGLRHIAHFLAADGALGLRSDQLGHLLTERERLVASEVRQAAQTVETRLLQVALAREVWDTWNTRIAQIEQERQVGQAAVSDLFAARLERLQAESQLIRQTVAYQLALVELREAQGSLAIECGYVPVDCP